MSAPIIEITNPESGTHYGKWDLKVLIHALSKPESFTDFDLAMCLRYELQSDQLEFKVVEHPTTNLQPPTTSK